MNYLIYKITNTVNNKIYIGCHKTQDVNDDYMGSGKILKRAIEKYGVDNFTKEVLHNFNNSEDMFSMESELVNEDFVKNQSNYNLKEGGTGGWDYINKNNLANNTQHGFLGGAAMRTRLNNDPEFKQEMSILRSAHTTKLHKEGKLEHSYFGNCNWQAKATNNAWTDTAREKRAQTKITNKVGQGIKNSQFGTMWITNNEVNKKIKKGQPIPDGFRKGRKIK